MHYATLKILRNIFYYRIFLHCTRKMKFLEVRIYVSKNLGIHVLELSIATRTWKSSLIFACQIICIFTCKKVEHCFYELFVSVKKWSLLCVHAYLFLERQIVLTLPLVTFKKSTWQYSGSTFQNEQSNLSTSFY